MARGNTSGTGNSNWYQVKNQKFTQSVKEGTENAIVTEKDGKKFYHLEFNEVSGVIKRLFIHDEDNGKGGTFKLFSIEMMDDKQKENIEMYFDCREAESFFRRLPNIDLKKPVVLIIRKEDPYTSPKTGKTYHNGRIDVYQPKEGEEKNVLVPFHYNKENPLPAYKKVTINGKEVTDKGDVFKKFEEIVSEANNKLGANPNAQDFSEVTNSPDNGSAVS